MRKTDETHGLRYAVWAMLAVLAFALLLDVAKAATESCAGPCVCTLSCQATGSAPVPVVPPPPPPVIPPPSDSCAANPNADRTTWQRVFGQAYPKTPGFTTNVGSSVTRRPVAGRVLAIRFTASETFSLRWTHAQRGPYGPATGVVFSISQCAGDVQSAGPCRKYGPEGSIRGLIGRGSYNGCGMTPGATYYLNVQFSDPQGNNTCASGESCDVAVQ